MGGQALLSFTYFALGFFLFTSLFVSTGKRPTIAAGEVWQPDQTFSVLGLVAAVVARARPADDRLTSPRRRNSGVAPWSLAARSRHHRGLRLSK
jgi:hypothetical protein